MTDDKTQAVVVLKPGANFKQYEVQSKLGSGGMGEVYLARDRQLDRLVALKFIPANLLADEEVRRRFIQEARAAARLNHPNIITIYEVAEDHGHLFIAMEYVDGVSLKELIQNGGLDEEQIVELMCQLCDGLSAAHKAGMIHRDIKPLNILIDKHNRIRILDFGLARIEGDHRLTQTGVTMGTVNYMSPEQAEGQDVDYRSDVFSVGIILYEMLTGKLPFTGKSIPAILHALLHFTPPDLKSLKPELDDKWQPIVSRLLAKVPDDRYQDLSVLRSELQPVTNRTSAFSISRLAIEQSRAIKSGVQSLAVLYLRNLGGSEDEFLCYGITEDLIVDLTRIGTVRVASMRSIMKFKDSDADLSEIARALDVGLILDGSIMKSSPLVRVSAQLVDVESGENLWAQRWEESVENLPRIKQALAAGVTEALRLGQTILKRAEVLHGDAENAAAYEYYLKAKYTFETKQAPGDIDIALGLYALALKEEPGLLAARVGMAEIMFYNADYASARIELETALHDARKHQSRAEEAQILRLSARLYAKQSNWPEAESFAREAVDISKATKDPAGEIAALTILISIVQPQSKFDDALGYFERILEISRELDDQDAIAEALKNMGVTYSRKGEYERAMVLYDESFELARKRGNLSLQASVLSNTGNILFFKGELDAAAEKYRAALNLAKKINNVELTPRQEMNLGLIHLMQGRNREGLELLSSAAEAFKESGDQSAYALAQVNACQARLTLGEIDEAITSGQSALSIARSIGHPLAEADALLQLGSAHFFNRDLDAAETHFHEAMLVSEQHGITRNAAHLHLALVSLAIYRGEYASCRAHASAALAIARELGDKTSLAMARAGLAAAEAWEGLYHSGLRQLRDAVRALDSIGHQQSLFQLRALLGYVLMAKGRTETERAEGTRLVEDVLHEAERQGFAPEVKFAEEVLAWRLPGLSQ